MLFTRLLSLTSRGVVQSTRKLKKKKGTFLVSGVNTYQWCSKYAVIKYLDVVWAVGEFICSLVAALTAAAAAAAAAFSSDSYSRQRYFQWRVWTISGVHLQQSQYLSYLQVTFCMDATFKTYFVTWSVRIRWNTLHNNLRIRWLEITCRAAF